MKQLKKLSAFCIASLLLLGLVAQPAAHAQRVGGPGRTVTTVYEGTTDVYHIRFYGRRPARVWAAGDGDIDITVYDANGHRVAWDLDEDGRPFCGWTPRRTGRFTIRVINSDDYDVDYVLRTN
jgi:hypothetical protein